MREPAGTSQLAMSIDMQEPAGVVFGAMRELAIFFGAGPRKEKFANFLHR